ncbi:MAG: SusC/RagA family TonB-linked outer membrane protein [Chitinophagaceae bacterium]|nr:SusC/RagA family TonB-linked outer membrane protein [Chitinophagaceae bacterium]
MKRKITNPLKNAQMKRNFQDLKDSCAFETRTLKISIITKNILFLIFLLSFQNSISQIGNVKVNVVDESENPIEGVLVGSVSNPETSGVTDSKGNVVLNMNPSGLIKLYFNDKEKMVSVNSNELTIELKKSDKKVNVGFGQIKTVDETTTAIDLVYSDKLEKSSLLNPNESLYGKLKGLMVLQNGGEPWDRDPTMYIRGVASLNSNRILVLVDGFERELSSLALQDIESVSVLKDGTDVAKYGLRGANGVILVTTKRGQKDSFNIGVSFDKNWNVPFRRPKFLNSNGYAKAVNQANQLDGTALTYSNQDLLDYKSGVNPYSHPNVDWWDETFRDSGFTNNLNTSFWGGGKSNTYFVSINYQNERGLIDNFNLDNRYETKLKYDRLNFRANLDIDLTNTTKFIMDASGYIGGQNEPNRRTGSIVDAIYSIPSAAFPVKYESGVWGGSTFYATNPVAGASSTGNSKPNYRSLYANGRLIQDLNGFIKGLSAELAIAYDNFASFFENNSRTYAYGGVTFPRDPITGQVTTVNGTPLGANNDLTNSQSFGDQIRHATGYAKLNYETKWHQNKWTASALYQEDKRVNDGQYNTFLRNNLVTTSSYAFKNRYFIDGVLSYSGTNLLPADGRFGLFPAVSAGWIISRENFLKGSKNINYLKLRGSWGKSGNDLIPANNLDRQIYGSGGSYSFGTGNVSNGGIREGRLEDPGISFESSEKVNIGLNAELFNKLTLSIDAFRDKRTDIIIPTSETVPTLLGVTPSYDNSGEVENKGIEGSFMFKSKIDKLNYFFGGNITYAKNKVINKNEEFRPYDYLRETGQSIGQRFGLQSIGFFENQQEIDNSPTQTFSVVRPGDVKYKDQNNDGVIDKFDEVTIGHDASTPEFYYAFNFGFEMSGFGLDVLMQGIANQTLYLNTKSVFWPLLGQTNISEFSENAWTPDNADIATLPRLTNLSNANNYRPNDIWLQSGSYLKMRQCEIYYNITKKLAKKLKISKGKLYARGTNLFSIDNINILDPESIGISYPTLSTYHLGFNIEF